jgi:hypothetical protein
MQGYSQSLFEVLSKDERIIVYSSEEDGCFYTWNQSLTLQCWGEAGQGEWTELDIRTLSDVPKSYNEARQKAIAWYNSYE